MPRVTMLAVPVSVVAMPLPLPPRWPRMAVPTVPPVAWLEIAMMPPPPPTAWATAPKALAPEVSMVVTPPVPRAILIASAWSTPPLPLPLAVPR